jgi:hypothetical protein
LRVFDVFQSDNDGFGGQSVPNRISPRPPLASFGVRTGAAVALIGLDLSKTRSLACAAIDSFAGGTPLIDAWIKGRGGWPLLGRFRRGCRSKLEASTDRGGRAIDPRVLPEPERDWKRVNVVLAPPRGLVTLAMKLAVVDPTHRDGELIADSVSECTRLHKREVMRIRRRPAAY